MSYEIDKMTQAELEKEVIDVFIKDKYLSVSDLKQKEVMHEHTWFVQKENRPPVEDPTPTPESIYIVVQP